MYIKLIKHIRLILVGRNIALMRLQLVCACPRMALNYVGLLAARMFAYAFFLTSVRGICVYVPERYINYWDIIVLSLSVCGTYTQVHK